MATQHVIRTGTWVQEFAPVIEFLARFGIGPGDITDYPEEFVLKAIRARGWDVQFEDELDPTGWRIEIIEWRAITQSQSAVARDAERMMALFRALRIALTWPSKDDEARAFDALARSLLDVSATECMEKWRHDELDMKDPRVVHLLIARPLGW